MTTSKIPAWDEIDLDTPLLLKHIAAIAFPDGSITEVSLRKERAKGRLRTERIAGKEYTTLADIQRMRELARGGND